MYPRGFDDHTRIETTQFGLKDPSLIKFQGLIDGKWVDAKDGAKIVVKSTCS